MGFKDLTHVTIYTDGASRGNGSENSIGAYGAVLQAKKNDTFDDIFHCREISEAFKGVTNNQMELMAVVKALELLQYPCRVTIYTDSKYVCDAINKRWLDKWVVSHWKTSTKKPVANKDIWERLEELLKIHVVNFEWVKGHADNEGNIKADLLCNKAMDNYIKNNM